MPGNIGPTSRFEAHDGRVDKATLLVVEDEENVSFVIVAALRLAGFEAVAVPNGRGALSAVEEGPTPDLVVLDVMLPDLDGFEIWQTFAGSGAKAAGHVPHRPGRRG